MDILEEIAGVPHYCWMPTKLWHNGGFYRDGWAWLRWVRKRHAIGFPRYYCTDDL